MSDEYYEFIYIYILVHKDHSLHTEVHPGHTYFLAIYLVIGFVTLLYLCKRGCFKMYHTVSHVKGTTRGGNHISQHITIPIYLKQI